MMNSWKTTIGLLLALAVSLGWVLRPAFPEPSGTGQASVVNAEKTSENPAEEKLATNRQAVRQRRGQAVFRLQTNKSLEEQRLHDLKLFRLFQENFGQVTWQAASRRGYPDDMSDLEILAKEREARLQSAHERFLALEDYILDTDFTELTEEEQDVVYQYYEWCRRVDEALSSYFDTPEETLLELIRAKHGLFRSQYLELFKRQYEHDADGMSLEDAFGSFFPQSGMRSFQTAWPEAGRMIEVKGRCPQTGGIPLNKPQ